MQTMRIGITCRFQNSYFSGSSPQVACTLAKVFQSLGHSVTLLHPAEDKSWFIDVAEESKKFTTKVWSPSSTDTYDLVVEVTWSFPAEKRPQIAKRVAYFQHYPPAFYDMESSVYMHNPTRRDFTNVTECWTWAHHDKQDQHYLEFLSGKPVYTLPFVWNFDAVDVYVRETGVPYWKDIAKMLDGKVTADVPASLSWCARIVESNASNCSHCIMPLNIVSEIRQTDPIRFTVHNGEQVVNNAFFQSNVVKNLLLPDISGNFVPRVRLPDLCREKSFIVAHQRFRPIKGYLLDALYLGIPLIHNCEMLKEFGYKYELNLIKEAASKWRQMRDDYANGAGYFAADQFSERRKKLKERFGIQVANAAAEEILNSDPSAKRVGRTIADVKVDNEIRVAFCDMWDQFHPQYNFFMSLLKWAGAQHGFKVSLNYPNPNLVIYGPFGDKHKKYKDVPKVFFTGENAGPRTDDGTFLNLGYQYRTESNYIRMPLWVLEINWFGEDPEKIVNPKPVPLAQCLKQDESVINDKKKFCAFVATNPKCQNRNIAFQILNQWRPVDSGGRLFCNLPGGPIPAGLGGGGGEHAKLDFYKKYKYALTFENESAPGYTTEKLFHAKVAGCVPIYWGDKFVDRDFDQKGFLNANTVSTPQELIALIENLEKDPEAWKAMAMVPALSEYKRHWCEKTMEQTVKQIVRKVLDKDIAFADGAWAAAESFHKNGERLVADDKLAITEAAVVAEDLNPPAPADKRLVVTATNKKYVASAALMIRSLRKLEPATKVHVYTWADVTAADEAELRGAGADEIRRFPVDTNMGWPDFWEPQHFAWKSWVQAEASRTAPDDFSVLYIDAGIEIVCSLDRVWSQIATHEFAVLEDSEQINRRWCHPTFCKELAVTEEELASHQILAGFVGFKARGKYYETVQVAALNWARKRDVIVGEKWKPYSNVCMGHRHDQSILSVLTHRAKVPRLQHRDFYCDRSRRTAENNGLALYVHRGAPRSHLPVALGIDDAYVINLERRKDRLEQFRKNPNLKDVTSVWKATDGRKLALTQDIARLFRNNDFKWKKSVMGCALSHMGLWKKLAEDPVAKTYLIMEDDVKFGPDWFGKWMGMAGSIPADADVIYLGGILPPNKASFPSVVEPVNQHFGRVAKNTLFGPNPRRYFHFCNYSYMLTQSGARKMMQLIAERGIFTSGDHMIVNHGDALFNIYFTTPLLTECIQEDDPVYVKSDFNNFSRLDTFDSDLWNNNEHFSQEEVTKALAVDMQKIDIRVVDKPLSAEELKRLNEEHERKLKMEEQTNAVHGGPRMEIVEVQQLPQGKQQAPSESPLTKEEKIKLWNDFLRAVALRKSEDVEKGVNAIFKGWVTHDDVLADISWFRIFEQLVLTDHPEILKHKQKIIDFVNGRAALKENIWMQIMTHLGAADAKNTGGVHAFILKPATKMPVFYLNGLDPAGFFEYDWFNSVFPHEIDWKATSTLQDLIEFKGVPVLLYMNPHGRNMTSTLNTILDVFKQVGKQLVIFHMSDEYARDDISVYGHPSVKHVIRNYWRAGLDREKVTVLPLGFAKGRSGHGLPEPPKFSERPNAWSFAGSADRPGRMEALKELRALTPHDERVRDSWSSPMKAESAEYCDLLRKSKFVPCMKGAVAMESFRLYEALEHGAIPFYVPSESHGCADEYREIFGTVPLMAVPSWKDAAAFLGRLAEKPDVMEAHRREVYNWWKQKKEEYRTKLKSVLEI